MSAPFRILLLDDNPNDRVSIIGELRREFPALWVKEVGEATEFAEALKADQGSTCPYDMVITDDELGWADGLANLHACKSRWPDLPVVMVTSANSQDMVVEAIKAGLDDYVLKSPQHLVHLSAAVQSVMERAGLRRALRQSEERYRVLAEAARDMIFIVAPDFTLEYANSFAVAQFGKQPHEIVGQSLDALFSAEIAAKHKRDLQTVFSTGQPVSMDGMTSFLGRVVWLSTWLVPMRNEAGQVTAVMGVARDISERKQAEAALHDKIATLETLAEISQGITAATEPQRVLDLVCRHAVELLRVPKAAIALYTVSGWTDSGASFGLSNPAIATQELDRLWQAGAFEPGILRAGRVLVKNDVSAGELYTPEFRAEEGICAYAIAPLAGSERVLGALMVFHAMPHEWSSDETQILGLLAGQAAAGLEKARLYQAARGQALHLAMLNEIGQAVTSTLDLDRVLAILLERVRQAASAEACSVALVNRDTGELVFRQAVGAAAKAVIGLRLKPGEGIAGWVMAHRQSVLIGDASLDSRFYRAVDRASGFATRDLVCVPLIARDIVIGVIELLNKRVAKFGQDDLLLLESVASQAAIAIENAQLYQVERDQYLRLQQSQALLIQAEKMAALGRLVSSVAHELNNPLQALQGSLELATEEVESRLRRERLVRQLGIACREVDRLINIVQRLRDFYRPARQEMKPTDVHVVLQTMLDLADKQLQQSQVIVECKWASGLPPILANPDHLAQVFLNLTINAIDSMSARGGTLRIRTALDQIQQPDSHSWPAVRIEFSDTGEGIAPENLPRVFEPFFTTKSSGTGLGLSISYHLIEAHDGQITVSSEPGAGTTFVILLPVSEE